MCAHTRAATWPGAALRGRGGAVVCARPLQSREDPLERKEGLAAAFTPAPPLETDKEDYLCTCVRLRLRLLLRLLLRMLTCASPTLGRHHTHHHQQAYGRSVGLRRLPSCFMNLLRLMLRGTTWRCARRTPENLLKVIQAVLAVYEKTSKKQKAGMAGQAAELMSPAVRLKIPIFWNL